MSDQVVDAVQDDADALASVMAGYNKEARTDTVPAESTEPSEQPVEEQAIAAEPTEAEKIASTLADLKSQVATIKSQSDPQHVRKLYGEIGNINRTLQQMQAKPPETKAESDELADALKAAEKVAEEYEEFGAPLVRALKAVASKPTTSAPVVDIDAKLAERDEVYEKRRQQDALEALEEEHPDWKQTRTSPEFDAWLASRPQEYQQKLMNSWNPVVVSKGLSEFKESLKSREKKQNRLAAAVTPQGVPAQPRSSTIPDEEGFSIGYGRGPKRLNSR